LYGQIYSVRGDPRTMTSQMPTREPAYKTVAASLRSQIEAGAYTPTRRLPTDAELSTTFGVSRQTVRQAFMELVAEGLVYRVRRRGSFAVPHPPQGQYLRSLGSIDDLLALSEDTELEVIEPFADILDVPAAARLQLTGGVVSRGLFRRLHSGVPFGLTTFYLPPEIRALIADDERLSKAHVRSNVTIIQLIEEARGIPIAGAHQTIGAGALDQECARFLDASAGEPSLAVDRVYFDTLGQVVEVATSMFDVRRYSYRVELRRKIP
jgi:GntR family transcriptional regulator